MRRIALSGAMDEGVAKGASGQQLFGDFNEEGECIHIGVKGARAFVIANGIKRPVFTDVCIVCCCIDLVLHLMSCRKMLKPTSQKFVVLW